MHVYPHLLGTYGDAGNALVLHRRALARGIAARDRRRPPGRAGCRATGDVYLLGGGEDAKQTAAAQELREDGGLVVAARRGAAVFGICAGLPAARRDVPRRRRAPHRGLGLLDVRTDRLDRRAVGNVLADPAAGSALPAAHRLREPRRRDAPRPGAARRSGRIEVGVGNGDGAAPRARCRATCYGTYLHGPALALNPALADRLLATAVGRAGADRRHALSSACAGTGCTTCSRRPRGPAVAGLLVALPGRRETAPSGATATLSTPGVAPADHPADHANRSDHATGPIMHRQSTVA